MKEYKVADLQFISDLTNFSVRNLTSISQSIRTLITAITRNRNDVATNTTNIADMAINAWSTVDRPTSVSLDNYIGINTTTNKLNHTIDGGTTWYNADGTLA